MAGEGGGRARIHTAKKKITQSEGFLPHGLFPKVPRGFPKASQGFPCVFPGILRKGFPVYSVAPAFSGTVIGWPSHPALNDAAPSVTLGGKNSVSILVMPSRFGDTTQTVSTLSSKIDLKETAVEMNANQTKITCTYSTVYGVLVE